MLQSVKSTTLLSAATVTGAGDGFTIHNGLKTFQATLQGDNTEAVSATVYVQVSNDNVGWMTAVTIALAGTGGGVGVSADTDGTTMEAPWKYIRGNVNAIAGVGANVTLTASSAI